MRLALALLLALAGGVALGVARRLALADWAIDRALASRGIPGTLDVARLGVGGATLEALRVGAAEAPDLSVSRVELAWSLAGLRARRFDRIEIRGLRARAVLGAEGLRLGALDALRGGPGDATAALAPPFAELRIEDAELRLETPRGILTLRGEGSAGLEAEALNGAFTLQGETPYGRIDAKAEISGSVETGGVTGLGWSADVTAPALELPGIARLAGVEVRAEGSALELRATLAIARFTDLAEPARIAPLEIGADLSGPFERIAVSARARTVAGGVALEAEGALEPFAARADLALRVPETDVSSPERQPARIFPGLADAGLRARGHVGAQGRVRYEGGALDARVTLAFRGLDLRTPFATLTNLAGAVELRGPAPLSTPPGQLVSMARIEGGLPLANGLVGFELTPDGTLVLERASWTLAKGRLSASGRLPLAAEERSLTLSAEGLDVETILTALAFEGLSGTGTLEGTLPLRQQGARVRIEGGRLRATSPGVLRYARGAGADALAKQEPQLGTVLGALEDLRYEELEIELSGDTSEAMAVKVHARGYNPNFQDGRPVVLNVNVEARLADLLKAGQAAYRVPEEVEKRVRRVLEAGER